jgi:hypothetical protein
LRAQFSGQGLQGGGQFFHRHSIREFPDESLARMGSYARF